MADVSIEAVRDRLRTLFLTVDGAKSAFSYMPRSIASADLPAFLIVPAETIHERTAGHIHGSTRNWRVTLMVAKDGEGTYGDAQKELEPFFERVEDLLFGNMLLDALDRNQISYAHLTDDTGEAMIEVPRRSGSWYLGAEWVIAITVSRSITSGT